MVVQQRLLLDGVYWVLLGKVSNESSDANHGSSDGANGSSEPTNGAPLGKKFWAPQTVYLSKLAADWASSSQPADASSTDDGKALKSEERRTNGASTSESGSDQASALVQGLIREANVPGTLDGFASCCGSLLVTLICPSWRCPVTLPLSVAVCIPLSGAVTLSHGVSLPECLDAELVRVARTQAEGKWRAMVQQHEVAAAELVLRKYVHLLVDARWSGSLADQQSRYVFLDGQARGCRS